MTVQRESSTLRETKTQDSTPNPTAKQFEITSKLNQDLLFFIIFESFEK